MNTLALFGSLYYVLNPYPEVKSRDTFWATTQGTPASWPL